MSALASIAVTPANPSIAVGATLQFTAIGTYDDATTADITASTLWTSENPAIGTITAGGLFTATAAGYGAATAGIGAIIGGTGIQTTATRTMVSLAIVPHVEAMLVGAVQQFTAIAHYADNSTTDVTATTAWMSDDSSVGSISANGFYTARSVGTAMLTAMNGAVVATDRIHNEAPVAQGFVESDVDPTAFFPTDADYGISGTAFVAPDGAVWFAAFSSAGATGFLVVDDVARTHRFVPIANLTMWNNNGPWSIAASDGSIWCLGTTAFLHFAADGSPLGTYDVLASATVINGPPDATVTPGFASGIAYDDAGNVWSTLAGLATLPGDSQPMNATYIVRCSPSGVVSVFYLDNAARGSGLVAPCAYGGFVYCASGSIDPTDPFGYPTFPIWKVDISSGASRLHGTFDLYEIYTMGVGPSGDLWATGALMGYGTVMLARVSPGGGPAVDVAVSSNVLSQTMCAGPDGAMYWWPMFMGSPSATIYRASPNMGVTEYPSPTASGPNGAAPLVFSPQANAFYVALTSVGGPPKYAKLAFGGPVVPLLVSLVIAPKSQLVAVGSSQQFTATGTYDDGSTADLTSTVAWNLSGAITWGTITPGGLYTAITPSLGGFDIVTATLGAVTGTALLKNFVPVTYSLSVHPPAPRVTTTGVQRFSVMKDGSDGTHVPISVTWATDDPTGTVDATGLYTPSAGSVGTHTITATEIV